MRISNTALSVFASLFLLTGISAPQSASAQSTQAPTIETQLQTSYTEYDFKLYKGIKGITDDKEVEGRKQFESERNALMKARPDLFKGVVTPVEPSAEAPTAESQLQTSYTDFNFMLYRQIKGIKDSDEVEGRKQFESERNALMKARPDLFKGVVTPVEPSAEAPTAEPGIRTKPNKPTYNSNRGTRKVEMKKSTNGKNRGKYIINIYFN
jgi:hypothetical protein